MGTRRASRTRWDLTLPLGQGPEPEPCISSCEFMFMPIMEGVAAKMLVFRTVLVAQPFLAVRLYLALQKPHSQEWLCYSDVVGGVR
jgi:hypothetical protein